MHKNTIADNTIQINKQPISTVDKILSILPFERFRNTKPNIAVLRLEGVIGSSVAKKGMSLNALNDKIEEAFEIPRLAAVMLMINSPGGSPVQSELIANRIRALSEEKKVPVYSFVEDVAASGGYWLACIGEEIYASKSSIVGSIGVISNGFGFKDLIKKLGVERRVYTQGNRKSVLDPFQDAKQEDIELIKKLQSQIHDHFVDYVKTRRHGKLTQSDEILFNGEFWSGQSAVDFGLIDGISDMYNFIEEKFGKEVNVKYIKQQESWFKKRLGLQSEGISSEVVSKLNEVESYSKFGIKF